MKLHVAGTVNRLNVEHRTLNKGKVSFLIKLAAFQASGCTDT
jgi:hypothetical protein